MKTKHTEASLFLFRKMWEFSKGNRRNVVIYILLSIIGFLVMLLEPAIFAMFLNELQMNWMTKDNMDYLTLLAFWNLFLVIIAWWFHATSRFLERKNAFKVLVNYKRFLFNKTLKFDLSWHTDRQSGDSIDKIEKSTKSLFTFSENTFEIIWILVKGFELF